MKVIGITQIKCHKCEWAKEQLKDFNIKWLTYPDDEEAKVLVERHSLLLTPVFIMNVGCIDPVIEKSVLRIKAYFKGEV